MSGAKRFKDDYPAEKLTKKPEQSNPIADKHEIEAYLKRISELMNDPQKQKKAALIIEQMINNNSKKGRS